MTIFVKFDKGCLRQMFSGAGGFDSHRGQSMPWYVAKSIGNVIMEFFKGGIICVEN
jgi:hypothetical protein